MNKFLNSFVFPVLVFFAVIFTAYTAVMYSYKRIKSDPINIKYATLKERTRQLDCLAENTYYEASNQSVEGKILVTQITINRANSGKFPSDICKVITQPYQFSWVLNKPRALRIRDKKAYDESMEVAKKVLLEGFRLPSIKNSLWYHAKSVNPLWNRNMKVDAVIGNHIAYSTKT